jgi:hypothetical protein
VPGFSHSRHYTHQLDYAFRGQAIVLITATI